MKRRTFFGSLFAAGASLAALSMGMGSAPVAAALAPVPDGCHYCGGPFELHTARTTARDGVIEMRITCPGRLERVAVEVTFQR